MSVIEFLRQPWPWYVAGPLIGLTVPALLLLGNKVFGLSSNLRHVCAMLPSKNEYFRYDWRKDDWNLAFAAGILLGGLVGGVLLANPEPLRLAEGTREALAGWGIDFEGELVPTGIFGWSALGEPRNLLLLLFGGGLVGFGARYASGCTSGHAISGLANLQLPSLIAVIGFFIGGLTMTHLLLPLLF